jgi:hypothetical protein
MCRLSRKLSRVPNGTSFNFLQVRQMNVLKNPAVKIGVIALAAFALAKLVQTKVAPIPFVGEYLPR